MSKLKLFPARVTPGTPIWIEPAALAKSQLDKFRRWPFAHQTLAGWAWRWRRVHETNGSTCWRDMAPHFMQVKRPDHMAGILFSCRNRCTVCLKTFVVCIFFAAEVYPTFPVLCKFAIVSNRMAQPFLFHDCGPHTPSASWGICRR